MDFDVTPMPEAPGQLEIGRFVSLLEVIECLIGEDNSESKCVVWLVPLQDGYC